MKPPSVVDVAKGFVEAINGHDVDAILFCMTADPIFLDSTGARHSGIETMRMAWIAYFKSVPDYWIRIDDAFEHGDAAVLFGTAGGTLASGSTLEPRNRWSTPAAWRMRVRGDKVAEWRVYADNEPIRELMRRSASE